MRRLVLGVAGTVLLLGACGGDGEGRFGDDVAAVRDAVVAKDPEAAEQALQTLALDALAAHEDGVIDDAELQEVAQLVDASRAELAEILPTTTTTEAPPPTTTEAPPAVEDDHDGDHDHDEGKGPGPGPGKGKGKGPKGH